MNIVEGEMDYGKPRVATNYTGGGDDQRAQNAMLGFVLFILLLLALYFIIQKYAA